MKRSKRKIYILFITVFLGLVLRVTGLMAFEMKVNVSIPHPIVPGETLTTNVTIGLEDRATDGFDTAWDVVAIGGGMIQASISHPEYDMATRALWRDTRASTGLPKLWEIEVQTSRAQTTVTLTWSSTNLSSLSSSVRIRLVDLDSGHQEIDMRSASTYTYLDAVQGRVHRFQIIMDEPTAATPPSDSTSSPGNGRPPVDLPSLDTPPLQTPPTENSPAVSPPVPRILTELLPQALLRRHYKVQLEAQGGTPPYRWQIVSGGLPQGLELNSITGVISGKPRRLGQYLLIIKLMTADGLIHQKAFTITIVRKAAPSSP